MKMNELDAWDALMRECGGDIRAIRPDGEAGSAKLRSASAEAEDAPMIEEFVNRTSEPGLDNLRGFRYDRRSVLTVTYDLDGTPFTTSLLIGGVKRAAVIAKAINANPGMSGRDLSELDLEPYLPDDVT